MSENESEIDLEKLKLALPKVINSALDATIESINQSDYNYSELIKARIYTEYLIFQVKGQRILLLSIDI